MRSDKKIDTTSPTTSTAASSTAASTTTSTATISSDFSDILYEAHWEGLSESEEESDIEISEPEDNIEESKNVFERLRCDADTTTTKLPYQRGPTLSKRQQTRSRNEQHDLLNPAQAYSQPIARFFLSTLPTPSQELKSIPMVKSTDELRQEAIGDLEKKLRSKETVLNGQNLIRHRAVLALLMTTQSRREGETREELSYKISRSFGKRVYFARKLVEWEGAWMRGRKIPEGTRGCYAKTSSWFNDEGVQMAVREWCAGAGVGLTRSIR